jgi:hypothetical protein
MCNTLSYNRIVENYRIYGIMTITFLINRPKFERCLKFLLVNQGENYTDGSSENVAIWCRIQLFIILLPIYLQGRFETANLLPIIISPIIIRRCVNINRIPARIRLQEFTSIV